MRKVLGKILQNTMKVFGIVALLVTVVAAQTNTGRLDGYQVLSVTAVTPSQFEFLKNLLVNNDDLDFWSELRYQGVTDIMMSSKQKDFFTGVFAEKGIKWSVKIPNVEQLITKEKIANDAMLLKANGKMSWTAYQRYAQISSWLKSIVTHDLVTLNVIGKSFEGRDLHQVKISTGNGPNGQLKPAIFIDANFHAREWISGATATWIINEIISNPQKYSEILTKYDLFIHPLVNPDGYEYSHTISNRMWRKTRSVNPGSTCFGADPNRNFAYFFGGEGTSSRPCTDTFKGLAPFSEPETRAIRDAIKKLQAERVVHAYFTIHSFGQLWLLSWGYTKGVYPSDFPELLDWGNAAVRAIYNVHQKNYGTGQGAELLGGVGGASDDWAKSQGIKFSTTLEVRDKGRHGFMLPPDQIIATAEEIWAGIQVIADPAFDPK